MDSNEKEIVEIKKVRKSCGGGGGEEEEKKKEKEEGEEKEIGRKIS